jgi:hypothetical protein
MNDFQDYMEHIFKSKWLSDIEKFSPTIFTEPISRNITLTPIQYACREKWFDGMDFMLSKISSNQKENQGSHLIDIVMEKYDNEYDKIKMVNIMNKNKLNLNCPKVNRYIEKGMINEIFEMSKKILGRETVFHKLFEINHKLLK